MKWNWIRLTNLKQCKLIFISDVFGLLSSGNFATTAMGCLCFILLDFKLCTKPGVFENFYINHNLFAPLLGVKGLTKELSSLECRVSFYLGGRNMKARLTPPPQPKKKNLVQA